MNVEVQMPKMGESITEGRILKWLKKPGDTVDRDETILEIATDKVDTEVPAPSAGVLVRIMAEEGQTVEVGTPIAVIETDAANAQVETAVTPAAAPEAPATPEATAAETVTTPTTSSHPPTTTENSAAPSAGATDASGNGSGTGGTARFYSPVVMRIAATEGVSMAELERIPGTGTGGRVGKSDILAYVEKRKSGAVAPPPVPTPAAPAPAASVAGPSMASLPAPSPAAGQGTEVIPMTNMQRLMAEHMVKSMQISPHVVVVSEVDMTNIVRFRDHHAAAFKQREGFSLTFMPFVAEAVVRALKDFPLVNSSVVGDSIVLKRAINLGVAVAMDDGGLIVPVVKNADTLNVIGLGRAVTDVATRARTRRLQPEEIQDGTFTITNFGVFGNVFGTPIINQPQVAILGVGAVQKKPVVIERDGEDSIAIRSMMYLSLSFDHRIIDGALGGRFIERVKQYLEDFSLASI